MFVRSGRLSVQFMQGSVTKHPCGIFGERGGGGGGLQYKRRPNLFHRASLHPSIGGTRLSGVRSAIHQRPTNAMGHHAMGHPPTATVGLLVGCDDPKQAFFTVGIIFFGMSQQFSKHCKDCECCPVSRRCFQS